MIAFKKHSSGVQVRKGTGTAYVQVKYRKETVSIVNDYYNSPS